MIESAPAIKTAQTTLTSADKELNLRGLMRQMKSVLVAYSGGVDSAYLGLIATQELGSRALCVMGLSPSVSAFQRTEGKSVAEAFGFCFETVDTSELNDPRYAANPANRCYFCKTELYTKLESIARDRLIAHVIDGTNADDLSDVRHGRKAAEEHSVRSPLAEAGLTKTDIREQSRIHGLPTWDRPASPCLASRVAPGVPVTLERLGRIEQGEAYLRSLGLSEFRVRVHGDLVRLEIAVAEMKNVLNSIVVAKVSEVFKSLGFRYVTLDLGGFRSGSMNSKNKIDLNLENN